MFILTILGQNMFIHSQYILFILDFERRNIMSAVEQIKKKKDIENVKKNFKETKIRDKVLFILQKFVKKQA